MSLLIVDALQGLSDPTYVQPPTGIVDPACLQVVIINGLLRITIKKNSLDGSYFTGDFIPNGSITQAQLANGCVGTAQLQDGSVTTAKLADHSVTQIKLALGAVTNTEIAAGTIISSNIAPNAIVTSLINPAAVTGTSIANATITHVNLAPGAVNTQALASACVTIPNLGADVLSLIQQSNLPAGTILSTGRSSPGNGFLLCDGSQVSRSVFSALFAAISTVYGPGDGATTFNVPDLRGRTIIGAGGGPGLTNRARGQYGGEESHLLSVAEMPYHTHTVVDNGHTHTVNEPYHSHSTSETPHGHNISDPTHSHQIVNAIGAGYFVNAEGPEPPDIANVYGAYGVTQTATSPTGIGIIPNNTNLSIVQTKIGISIAGAYTTVYNQPTGSSTVHNNMQPYQVCNFIIKT